MQRVWLTSFRWCAVNFKVNVPRKVFSLHRLAVKMKVLPSFETPGTTGPAEKCDFQKTESSVSPLWEAQITQIVPTRRHKTGDRMLNLCIQLSETLNTTHSSSLRPTSLGHTISVALKNAVLNYFYTGGKGKCVVFMATSFCMSGRTRTCLVSDNFQSVTYGAVFSVIPLACMQAGSGVRLLSLSHRVPAITCY